MIRRIAYFIILSAGWKRRLIAFFAGVCGSLAMAPVNFFPAIAVTFTIAVWLIDGCHQSQERGRFRQKMSLARHAAAVGWCLGFGYFLSGLWWLGKAFLVDADQFAWAILLGVIGLPALLAFFTALGFWLAALLWSTGFARLLALAVAVGASEWLRSVLFTGFPWNEFGMVFGGQLLFAQLASIIGLHGLTFVTIACAAAPASLVQQHKTRGHWSWIFLHPLTMAGAVLIASALFGYLRLTANPVVFASDVRLRIMQPNVPQDQRFHSKFKDEILSQYFALSDRNTSPQTSGVASATHLIWPESAFPFILSRDSGALARIGAFLPAGTVLVTGAARREDVQLARRVSVEFYNSIQVMERGGAILATYDKIHLVPFGEYLPLSGLLEKLGLRQFVNVPGGFTAGKGPRILSVPGLPAVAPLVCYEAIFPGAIVWPYKQGNRPGLLLNVTNDAWFGLTPGPYQHFAQARLRSVEEGLPMVRAANSGLSGVIDPFGRVIAELPLSKADVLDSGLPIAAAATVYARYPVIAPAGLGLFLLFIVLVLLWRKPGAAKW